VDGGLAQRIELMGIVNTTPDSFSDGGRYFARDRAVEHGERLLDEGASWIDVGGESTRPGAARVDAEEEARRVVPVIAALRRLHPEASISVDTSKTIVARAAIAAGATMVNDVCALSDLGMAELCAQTGVQVVLMHKRGTPAKMQHDTHYADLASEVHGMLATRAEQAIAAGIAPERIVLDPGIGFGKAPGDNPALFTGIPKLRALGHRVLIGASRKRFIGAITGVTDPAKRIAGSVGAALAAASFGADLLRVHDVAETRHALQVFLAITRPEACA
jgi:dihydropteroate synthase